MKFESDCFSGWVVDPELRRSMEFHCERLKEAHGGETFWSLYWHAQWREKGGNIARRHLSAYLQEACYWAAQKAMRVLKHTQYRLSDCFQLASLELDRILAGYDPTRGASLKSYARMAYPSIIRDILRQRQEADICTGWTLLRRVGKKRLLESLDHAGLKPEEIGQFRLAWECYKALSGGGAGTRRQQGPDRQEWDEMAALYNQERRRLSQPGPALTGRRLEQRLCQSIIWVREYTYPPVSSLNRPRGGQEAGELQDELTDPQRPSLMASLIEQEEAARRGDQRAELSRVIIGAIGDLSSDRGELLRLYYQAGLTQAEIAQVIGVKQYTVSRRLSRSREALIGALVKWSQEKLHIQLTPALVRSMSEGLEEWLSMYYDAPE